MNLDIELHREFFTKEDCVVILGDLIVTTEFHEFVKDSDDNLIKLKRKMAYHSFNGEDYKYANFTLTGSHFNTVTGYLLKIVNEYFNYDFNSVLLNYYKDGRDEIKWHSDKETQLGSNPVILTLNFGATRKFHFLEKATGEKSFEVLNSGDVLIMKENCQENYLHAILKESEVKEPRISLTFRKVI